MGDRACVALTELRREDARKLRDYMLASDKKGGGKLSPSSVQREIKIMSAVVTLGIKEFDLTNKAHNPFEKLEIKGSEEDAPSNGDIALRDPLPAAVIVAMRKKLKGDLLHIWRVLDGTGCRLAEITGLRTEDVVTGGDLPHIRVHWHTSRRLKTPASIREVPLVGDALSAAVEALVLSKGAAVLFPRYARDGGPTATSAALMKHLRQITTDKRQTVHSLRHNMKDRLRTAKVPKDVQDLVLGHSAKGAGERFYGSAGGKLGVAMRAMQEIVWD